MKSWLRGERSVEKTVERSVRDRRWGMERGRGGGGGATRWVEASSSSLLLRACACGGCSTAELERIDERRHVATSDRHCRPHNIAAGCCVMSEGLAWWLPSKSVPVGDEDREEEGDSEEKDERGSRVCGVVWGEGR